MNVWKPGGVLFENMLRRSSEALRRSFGGSSDDFPAMENPCLTGLLYYQGETDGGDAETAGEYARNLTDFITRVRQKFGANLPIVICLISGVDARVPYREEVRRAQRDVAQQFDAVACVETCDLELKVCMYASWRAYVHVSLCLGVVVICATWSSRYVCMWACTCAFVSMCE
jgi:hypothetical protein